MCVCMRTNLRNFILRSFFFWILSVDVETWTGREEHTNMVDVEFRTDKKSSLTGCVVSCSSKQLGRFSEVASVGARGSWNPNRL